MHLFFRSQSLQLLIFNMWMFFYAFICDIGIIKVKHPGIVFVILSCLIFFFLHMRSLLVPYACVSIELIDCILLSSFELRWILIISSVKTLCLSLLNLLLFACFLWILIYFLSDNLHQFLSFLNSLLYFQFEMFLNSFYNPDI